RDRPAMLDQGYTGGGPVRDRVDCDPHVFVVEDLTVLQRFGARLSAGFEALLAGHAEPEQRADRGAELHRLLLVEIARVESLDIPLVVFVDNHHVDDANDVGFLEALELLEDLPFELRVVEAHHEQLHGADGHSVIPSFALGALTFPAGSSASAPR